MGMELRRRFKREGTYVYLWLICVDIWPKPSQYYNIIILQFKTTKFLKMKTTEYPNRYMKQSLEGTKVQEFLPHRFDNILLVYGCVHPPGNFAEPALFFLNRFVFKFSFIYF